MITFVFENTTDVCVSVFALKIKSSKNALGQASHTWGNTAMKSYEQQTHRLDICGGVINKAGE